ncbi:MAG: FtsX-like permease family protein [Kiritimatiellae bacterium]|nr:FtsX-like permease family protein [Kiritimatiellia bacterium]
MNFSFSIQACRAGFYFARPRPGFIAAALLLGATQIHAISPQFDEDCRALTGGAHRLTGSPELAAAQDYVKGRLRAITGAEPVVQPFPALCLKTRRCELRLAIAGAPAGTLPLTPARPNDVIPPVTPPEGITGTLLYAGPGNLTDYGNRSPDGKIVVLDYNSPQSLQRAFRLGAKAVIFASNSDPLFRFPLGTAAPANVPRFYYAGKAADLPEGATATIFSEATWEPGQGKNLLALISGTNPVFSLEQREIIVLAANLDTFGEVPDISPGARGAANCAALLKIAEALNRQRPRRDILIAFFDGQAQGHAGVSAFYRAMENQHAPVELATRQQALNAEREHLQSLSTCFNLSNNAWFAPSPARDEIVRRFMLEAAGQVNDLNLTIQDLNRFLALLQRDLKTNPEGPARENIKRQQDQLNILQAAKERFNNVRRMLSRGKLEKAETECSATLSKLAESIRNNMATREKELAENAQALAGDTAVINLVNPGWISLHASLLLGDTTPRWGLIVGGDSIFHSSHDEAGLYNKVQATFAAAAERIPKPALFETATVNASMSSRIFWAGPLVHSGEIAGLFGIYNIAFGTVQENLAREGTPDDTPATLKLESIENQAAEIGALLAAAADQEGLSLNRVIVANRKYSWPQWNNGQVQGPAVMNAGAGGAMATKPLPHAVVSIYPSPATMLTAFNNLVLLMSDANASYGIGPLPPFKWIGHAVKFDERGEVRGYSQRSSATAAENRLTVFPCAMSSLVNGRPTWTRRYGAAFLPPHTKIPKDGLLSLSSLAGAKVLNAISDTQLDDNRSYFATRDGIVYWYCDRSIEQIKVFGPAISLLINGPDSLVPPASADAVASKPGGESPYGQGLSLLTPWAFPRSAAHSAADLWRLNQYRLNLLRERGVMNTSIEELHGRAEDLLKAAQDEAGLAGREALTASAFLAEQPVYNAVRQSLNDLVRAVLILLLLAIPFAFALERLLLGSTNIYRQIGWFCAFFLGTFIAIYLVHPAFAVSQQPIIIFLAFALMLLSGFVIFILMRKFEEELKQLQGLTSTVHTADVSRFGTMMAAMSMGISTMRRRPLRTALTAVTIMLLTFTILNFASFDLRIGVVSFYQGAAPKYSGAATHNVDWDALPADMLELVQNRWGNTATVAGRFWFPNIAPNAKTASYLLLTREDGTRPMELRGILGLEAAEIARRADLRALLGDNAGALTGSVFMTGTMAANLGVKPGDTVRVAGVPLRLAGCLDASRTIAIKDLDGAGILPVDFVAMCSSQNQQKTDVETSDMGAATLAAAQSRQDWVALPPDQALIVSRDTALRMGASLHAINVYTHNAGEALEIAEDMARCLPTPVTATHGDGVYTHVLAPTMATHGVKDLLLPIVLGGLVIFGTMLGSVADREREIYTFSALGLAPAHVATLFFAEALVYAFIGGLGGYLLAQAMLKAMILMYNFGILRSIPEMNYSSLNAIITIMIVMATVLLSAIYPAFKASRSANPGILRSWRLPSPDGDRFTIAFPFTVSQYDIIGVLSFLKEHFDNFSDTSLGLFMARDTRIIGSDPKSLGLHASMALAPFDLGVTQEFTLHSVPGEIEGIEEVAIELTRKSGQKNDWVRSNKALLDDLRRQFLIWRSLPHGTMEHYRQSTLSALGKEAP